MRLRFLLHCVQCHLVLLILVAFGVAGYLLRDELGALVARPQPGSGLTQPRSAIDAKESPGPAGAGFTSPGSPGDGLEAAARQSGTGLHPQPSAERGLAPAPAASAVRQGPLDADSLLTQGEFSFRPLDDEVASDPGDAERRNEMLAAARRAYWNHDLPLAIRHYQALIQAFPNDPDYFGEVGNIYFEQGRNEQAAQAYYEAALLLLARGQRTRAGEMVELLQKTSPSHAESLLERLQGTP